MGDLKKLWRTNDVRRAKAQGSTHAHLPFIFSPPSRRKILRGRPKLWIKLRESRKARKGSKHDEEEQLQENPQQGNDGWDIRCTPCHRVVEPRKYVVVKL